MSFIIVNKIYFSVNKEIIIPIKHQQVSINHTDYIDQ
jgi:hypothetical protein